MVMTTPEALATNLCYDVREKYVLFLVMSKTISYMGIL